MTLSKVLRIVKILGILFTIVGDLFVKKSGYSEESYLDPSDTLSSESQEPRQDPLSHGEVNEKPEEEVQGELDFDDDSIESSRSRGPLPHL